MEILCPHCGVPFDMDDDVADRIREQVRNQQFEKELRERIALVKKEQDVSAKLCVEEAVAKARKEMQKTIDSLRKDLSSVQSSLDKAEAVQKEQDAMLDLRVKEAVSSVNEKMQKKLDQLRNEAEEARAEAEKEKAARKAQSAEAELRVKEAVADETARMQKKLDAVRDEAEAARSAAEKAKADLVLQKAEQEAAVGKAVLDVKTEMSEQVTKLEAEKAAVISERDFYKDMKTRMSTKMVGESLEQHCEIEFNKIRMTAFPLAEFGKDNTVSAQSGSKGDYIFREFAEDGTELISIMFEMKNEMDTTATKKKNVHFLKELDKDRKEKKCEYAVLVSLLESDNELYNQGIVDMSYQYDKMYVIRPQFFIPLISILCNAARRSAEIRRELVHMQQQNVDLYQFESHLTEFKEKFSYNYEQASKRFDEAIAEIDKTVDHLQKVKSALLASGRQLRLANDKVDAVTIRKLTADSPSIRAQIEGGPQG